MTIDIDKYNKRLDKRIREFSGHFMNDAKWTKVFTLLSRNNDIIKKCLIKHVLDDTLRQIEIPPFEKFSDTFHDKGIKDVMIGGPSTFKEIEWIEFPSRLTHEPQGVQQDIFAIKNLLDKIGQLATELDDNKLVVYGYR